MIEGERDLRKGSWVCGAWLAICSSGFGV